MWNPEEQKESEMGREKNREFCVSLENVAFVQHWMIYRDELK